MPEHNFDIVLSGEKDISIVFDPEEGMPAYRHEKIETHVGETVTLNFTVRDKAGELKSLTSAAYRYLIGHPGEPHLLEIENADIEEADSIVSVEFDVSDIEVPVEVGDPVQFLGKITGQLFITESGADPALAAHGFLQIDDIIG